MEKCETNFHSLGKVQKDIKVDSQDIMTPTLPIFYQISSLHFIMPQCDGCSTPYRYMEGKWCEPCQESTETPKMRDKWSLCSQCSRRFEFLSGNECLGCKERNLADKMAMPPPQSQSHAQVPVPLSPRYENRDIEHAMSHPVNARTHSARGAAPYSNAFQTYEKYSDENDVSLLKFYFIFNLPRYS